MDEYPYGLQDYLRVFRERWRTIAAVTAFMFVFSMLLTYARGDTNATGAQSGMQKTPLHSENAGETAHPSESEPDDDAEAVYVYVEDLLAPADSVTGDPGFAADFERLRLLSQDVLRVAASKLGVSVEQVAGSIEVEPLGVGPVFVVRAQDVNGLPGAALARAVAEAYLARREQEIGRRYRIAIKALKAQIAVLRASDGSADTQVTNEIRIAVFEARVAELQAARSAATAGGVVKAPQFASQATQTPTPTPTPSSQPAVDVPVPAPAGKPYARNGVAGLVLGMILGAGLALIQDVLDPRFRTAEEVELRLGLPIMAALPDDDAYRHHAVEGLRAQISHRGVTSLAIVSLTEQGTGREVAERLATSVEGPEIVTVSSVTDPEYLASAGSTDATILVIDQDHVTRHDAVRELGKLQRSGAEVLGCVVA